MAWMSMGKMKLLRTLHALALLSPLRWSLTLLSLKMALALKLLKNQNLWSFAALLVMARVGRLQLCPRQMRATRRRQEAPAPLEDTRIQAILARFEADGDSDHGLGRSKCRRSKKGCRECRLRVAKRIMADEQ